MTFEPAPTVWEPGLLDSKLEADLTRWIENARSSGPPPRFNQTALSPLKLEDQRKQHTTLAQQVAGCGIAVIDGYLSMKDYAAQRGLDLAEFHHKGIDLQDLLSTVLIGMQYDSRDSGARRYKR
jgi:hypothetical protein